jgi:hypothetical protein
MVSLWAGVGGGATSINASLIQAGVDSMLMPPDQSSSVPYHEKSWRPQLVSDLSSVRTMEKLAQ